ncbi:MAG: hypothetical protein GEU92_00835 [Alphaproteobacteria bacterium]|nr:hypothetical protein [Alphaproteobacteria bacterium]
MENEGGPAASSPSFASSCFRDEVLSFLNELLEGERAGAKGVGEMSKRLAPSDIQMTLRDIARDEARFCLMLTRHIERLGAQPRRDVGAFYQKLVAEETFAGRLCLLQRGQGWVVRKLRDVLPRIRDESLQADLEDMLEVHERNIARCAAAARDGRTARDRDDSAR